MGYRVCGPCRVIVVVPVSFRECDFGLSLWNLPKKDNFCARMQRVVCFDGGACIEEVGVEEGGAMLQARASETFCTPRGKVSSEGPFKL